SDEDALRQVLLLMGAGGESERNLIADGVHLPPASEEVAATCSSRTRWTNCCGPARRSRTSASPTPGRTRSLAGRSCPRSSRW
ncbi:hypothetical protein, partial [Actinoallomurus acaciae]